MCLVAGSAAINIRDFTKSQRERRRQRENDVMCALRMHKGHPQRFHVFAVTAPNSNHLFSRSENVKICWCFLLEWRITFELMINNWVQEETEEPSKC